MKKDKKWFSVILAILMTWFMIIVTSWVFLLVLWENKDTKSMEYYYKSLEWANWSLELALLKAKKYNYSFDETLDNSSNFSKILYWNSNVPNYKENVKISYNISSISNEIIDKNLSSWDFDIIPLFFYDNNWIYKKVRNLNLSWTWLNSNFVWNIVWNNNWISWVWTFSNSTNWNFKTINWNNVSFQNKSVSDFLSSSEYNYLILQNLSLSQLPYNLKSLNSWEYLTKDKTKIIATWEAGWFKQNLVVTINTSKYLNLLKYSVFSEN